MRATTSLPSYDTRPREDVSFVIRALTYVNEVPSVSG